MTDWIPNWLHRRYIVLWKEFGRKKFSFDEAQDILGDDPRVVNLLVAGLRKGGWLTSEKDPKHPKKKLYQIIDVKEVYEEMKNDVQVQERSH